MKKCEQISLEEVKRLVTYNPETGEFWRLVKTSNNAIMDRPMGSLDAYGYLIAQINSIKNIKLHRLVWFYMTGEWPKEEIDHKNRIKTDNRLENLRLASRSQNEGNTKKAENQTSRFKGVSFAKREQRWYARLHTTEKVLSLGYFNSERDAGIVYNEAAKKYFGEFACLNDIDYTEEEYIKILKTPQNIRKSNLSSKYIGVSYHSYGMWQVSFKGKYLGLFRTEQKAALAYNKKAIEVLGNQAKLNFID